MKPMEHVTLNHISVSNSEKYMLKNNMLNNLDNRSGDSKSLYIDSVLKEIHEGYLAFIGNTEKRKQYICAKNKEKHTNESTVKNILKRKEDVTRKISQIKEDNLRLQTILASKQSYHPQHQVKSNDLYKTESSEEKEEEEEEEEEKEEKEGTDTFNINKKFSTSLYYTKSWQNENSLDMDSLLEKSHQLQHNLKCLQSDIRDRYEKKERSSDLKEEHNHKEKHHEAIATYNKHLKDILYEREQQIQILKEELADKYPDEKPNRKHLQSEPLLPMLEEKKFDSVEPKDQKLVSSCILYVNKFNEEFKQQHYKLAAQLAVNSPRGILRTYNTFLLFKNATTTSTIKFSPIFLFCEALMKTNFHGGLIGENLSVEVIRCAVVQSDIQLAKHWLYSVILTWSKEIGDLLISTCHCKNHCECGWTLLALEVYSKIKLYQGVILCHLKFNNFKHVTKYMKESHFSHKEFKDIISSCPGIQLSYLLSDVSVEGRYVTLAGMVSTFLHEQMYGNIVDLLTLVCTEGLHGASLFDCLLKETGYDDMGEEKWEEVLNICINSGKYELAEELHSCLTTRNCLNNATIFCMRDYIS